MFHEWFKAKLLNFCINNKLGEFIGRSEICRAKVRHRKCHIDFVWYEEKLLCSLSIYSPAPLSNRNSANSEGRKYVYLYLSDKMFVKLKPRKIPSKNFPNAQTLVHRYIEHTYYCLYKNYFNVIDCYTEI